MANLRVNQTILREEVRALRASHLMLRDLDPGEPRGLVVRARPVPKRPEDHI